MEFVDTSVSGNSRMMCLKCKYVNTRLVLSCVSAHPTTKVDLLACFAERLFKSS